MNHLRSLYEHATGGLIAITRFPDKHTKWFAAADFTSAYDYSVAQAQNGNVYHCWALHTSRPASGRGKAADACGIPGAMLDIDVFTTDSNVHSRNHDLPRSWEKVLDHLLECGVPSPTSIRHSGNGAYFDWLFHKPWMFDQTGDRDEAAQTLYRFNAAAAEACRRKGWALDTVGDLARITRLPGTLNHKTQPPKSVRLLDHQDSRRLDVAELKDITKALETRNGTIVAKTGSLSTNDAALPAKTKPSSEDATANWNAIVAGCRWAQQTVENSDHLAEPDWHALAGILACCVDGKQKFHQLSANDPRYDRSQTEEKFIRADVEAGPRSCDKIERQLGFEGCQRCPFSANATIKSPVSLGRERIELARLMSDHVYDVDTAQYINVTDGTILDDGRFSKKFRHLTGSSTPHNLLVSNKHTLKADKTDYLPGNPRHFPRDDKGRQLINLWTPSDLKPAEGLTDILDSHLCYLFPEDDERDHFLNALAHALQHPGIKIGHVLLLIGSQGTGKSFVGQLAGALFGNQNTYIANSVDLASDWTAQMGNRQLLILEELGVFDKRHVYENLKQWVTDPTVNVNEKHLRKYVARTPKFIMGISNHSSPIAIARDDRRFWVSHSPAEPRESSYYERLFDQGMTQSAAFLHNMLRRDLSRFSPTASPPMTKAKQDVIERSMPIVAQELKIMMDEGAYPFTSDLIVLSKLADHVSARVRGRPTSTPEVQKALTELGGIPIPQFRAQDGSRPRVWAWRNQDRWYSAKRDELSKEYLGIR